MSARARVVSRHYNYSRLDALEGTLDERLRRADAGEVGDARAAGTLGTLGSAGEDAGVDGAGVEPGGSAADRKGNTGGWWVGNGSWPRPARLVRGFRAGKAGRHTAGWALHDDGCDAFPALRDLSRATSVAHTTTGAGACAVAMDAVSCGQQGRVGGRRGQTEGRGRYVGPAADEERGKRLTGQQRPKRGQRRRRSTSLCKESEGVLVVRVEGFERGREQARLGDEERSSRETVLYNRCGEVGRGGNWTGGEADARGIHTRARESARG
jgi:hypothetical protein